MNIHRLSAIALILLGLPFLAGADILVYKLIERNSVTGDGGRFSYRTSGFWVTDWDTGEVQTIKAFRVFDDAFFQIDDSTASLREYQVIARATSRSVTSYTYITRYDEFTPDESFQELHTFLKGRDTLLSISPWRQIVYPKGFRGLSQLMDFRPDVVFATESSVKLLLDGRLTTTANINAVTLEQMIDTLAIILMEDGYTEIVD